MTTDAPDQSAAQPLPASPLPPNDGRMPWQRIAAAWKAADATDRVALISDWLTLGGIASMCVLVMIYYQWVQYALWVALAGVALRPFTRERFSRSPVQLALLLWVVAIILTDVVNGLSWDEADRTLTRQWRLLVLVVMLHAGAGVRRWRPHLLGLLLITSCASVAVAWYQRNTGSDPFWGRDMAEWFVESTGKWRGNGMVDHPLTLAGQCAMLAMAVLVLVLHWRGNPLPGLSKRISAVLSLPGSRLSWLGALLGWRVVALVPLAGMGIGLIAAASRGYIAVLVGVTGLMVLVTLRGRWLALGALLMAALLPALTLMPTLQARFSKVLPAAHMQLEGGRDRPLVLDFSEPDRIARLHFGLQVVADYPIFGVGADHDRYWAAMATRSEAWARAHRDAFPGYHAHNAPLQITIETGLVGLMAWLSIWLVLLRAFGRAAIDGAWGPHKGAHGSLAWPLAGLFVLVLFMAAGLFEHNFDDSEVQCLLWLLMGLCLWPATPAVAGNAVETKTPWPVSFWALALHTLWIWLALSAVVTFFTYPPTVALLGGLIHAPREVVSASLLVLSALGAFTLRHEITHPPGTPAPAPADPGADASK